MTSNLAKLKPLPLQLATVLNAHSYYLLGISPSLFKKADFSWMDMSGAYLVGANMIGIDFTESTLRNADLKFSTLKEAIVDGVDFAYANMEKADLSSAKGRCSFWEANLAGANLEGSDLQKSNFTGAHLHYASFKNANLKEIKLPIASSIPIDNTDFSGADISKIQMFGTCFKNSNFSGSTMRECTMFNPVFRGCKFDGVDLTGAVLIKGDSEIKDPAIILEYLTNE